MAKRTSMSITLSIKLIRFRSVGMEHVEMHSIADIQKTSCRRAPPPDKWKTTKELGTRLVAYKDMMDAYADMRRKR